MLVSSKVHDVMLLAVVATVSAFSGAPDVRLTCPDSEASGWAVIVQEDALSLVAASTVEHFGGGGGTPPTRLTFTTVRLDEPGASASEASWQQLTLPFTTFVFPRHTDAMAALTAEDDGQVHMVRERMGAELLLTWTIAPLSWFAGTRPSGPAGRTEVGGGALPQLKIITDIRDADSSAPPVRSALSRPSLASFHGRVLLACNAGARNAVTWVGHLAQTRQDTIEAVRLGPGAAPALVPAGDTLFCFAIEPALEVRPASPESRAPGRLLCWKSSDAEHWEPWAPGVPLNNVVRVDACNEGDTTLVACLTAAPEPRIHVYRLDPDKEGLTELLTVDPAPEGELGRDIAIRLLKGKAYLFWQDNVGADEAAVPGGEATAERKTYIVMRRLELPRQEE
jgi:hypothetical protein